MIYRFTRKAVASACISLAAMSVAEAGGFSRGTANLDPLYGVNPFTSHFGATFVSPGRSYSSATGAVVVGGAGVPFSQSDVEFGENYFVPSVSIGGQVFGDLRCTGSYTQPYGVDAVYSGAMTYHIAEQKLETNEFGLTCGYGFDVGKGRLSLIGGAFYETVEFGQARNFTLAFGIPGDSRVDLESNAWGYRLGVGYEIPEIAFKAQLLYRSQTDHDATGSYSNTPFAILAMAGGLMTPEQAAAIYGNALSTSARSSASLPQSVDLNLQSGIAPDWLAFGSVKWTDWSVLKDLRVIEGIANQPFSTTRFHFKDGWTVTGGVGHRFAPQLSGSLSLTWDKGVSGGWDTLTDTWSIAAGLSYDVNENFQIRGGGAAIYFTEGSKDQLTGPLDYRAQSSDEWVYALSAGAVLKF